MRPEERTCIGAECAAGLRSPASFLPAETARCGTGLLLEQQERERSTVSKPRLAATAHVDSSNNPDADDESDAAASSESSSDDSNSDDDDSSEDETAELMRELARIKKEREEEAARRERERQERDEQEAQDAALNANPLLAAQAQGAALADNATLKKRWWEESVFKNQAKSDDQPKKKRFVNDTVRNEFHQKFLKRYVK